MRRRTLLGAAVACLALWSSSASVSHADVRVDNVQVPFYARVIEGEKWTAAIFYRPPGRIPPEFNLITFFNVPRVFDCGPMTLQGYAIFENGPESTRPRCCRAWTETAPFRCGSCPATSTGRPGPTAWSPSASLRAAAPAPRERAHLHEGPGEQPLPFGLPLPCARDRASS